jgi:hypothetical protein
MTAEKLRGAIGDIFAGSEAEAERLIPKMKVAIYGLMTGIKKRDPAVWGKVFEAAKLEKQGVEFALWFQAPLDTYLRTPMQARDATYVNALSATFAASKLQAINQVELLRRIVEKAAAPIKATIETAAAMDAGDVKAVAVEGVGGEAFKAAKEKAASVDKP